MIMYDAPRAQTYVEPCACWMTWGSLTGRCPVSLGPSSMCSAHTRCRIGRVMLKDQRRYDLGPRRCPLVGAPCNCDELGSQCLWRAP